MSQLLINQYLNELAQLKRVSGVNRESVVREAFKDLLKGWGKSQGLTFIPEYEFVTTAKVRNYVDGALLHDLRVPFGYWEAKDEKDDLDAEIAKKFRRGYPNTNIIFEDSTKAVLIQNGQEVMRCAVDAPELEKLISLFFAYQRPEIADFRKAVIQFKADLPAVLDALRGRIDEAYAGNAKFKTAADTFLRTAKETINPSVTEADVREMLIQHILTEEIFAHVFNDGDFHHENNVAKALYGLENEFFKGDVKRRTLAALEPYYAAIRSTAALISSHAEKQGFLKAIYENFYKVYNPKAADKLGVVYTPNEIVRFMIESTDWLCEKHFGKSLIDQDVNILDPATGTGTFIVELLEHFKGRPEKLIRKYLTELYANEVAILPYYVANLNIEATYAAIAGKYEEFPGLCFVDTLDNVAALGIYSGHQHDLFAGISDENSERVRRQNTRKISVVIGNPPYNANQQNENENNKNREYPRIDERIKSTYINKSTAQKTKLYDMYARFFRWASDRLDKDGIISFVTNRSFLDSRTFDGFRNVVSNDFSEIYVIDLGGDVRSNPKISGTKHNVFGIQTGVAISFLIRKKRRSGCRIFYARRPEFELAEEKLSYLSHNKLSEIKFDEIKPDNNNNWLNVSENDWEHLIPIVDKHTKSVQHKSQERAVFKLHSLGVVTNRDEWVYSSDKPSLERKVQTFIEIYERERKAWHASGMRGKISDAVSREIKWTSELEALANRKEPLSFNPNRIRLAAYRPFNKIQTYYDRHITHRVYQQDSIFPIESAVENRVIVFSDPTAQKPWLISAVDTLPDLHYVGAAAGAVCASRHRYANGERLDNITDWALTQFANRYGKSVTKDDIFAYVYAVLHDPVYRETYALNLKREFPRVPLYPDFKRWRDWGQALLDLHIGYESVEPFALTRVDTPDPKRAEGTHPAVKLKSDPETGNIVLDAETQLSGAPPRAWDYRLGNRSAIDWVLDQHKEKTPKDPTIREKFNTYRFADYKDHVIDLLGRVVAVSLATVDIVEAMRALPASAREHKLKADAE